MKATHERSRATSLYRNDALFHKLVDALRVQCEHLGIARVYLALEMAVSLEIERRADRLYGKERDCP